MKKKTVLFSLILFTLFLFSSCPHNHFDDRPPISSFVYARILGERPSYHRSSHITIVAPSITIEESDIEFVFYESDYVTIDFSSYENFPIKMKAGETKKLKFFLKGNESFRSDTYEVTITCTLKKKLHLKKLTVCGVSAATSVIYVEKEKDVITKDDIELIFNEVDAPKDFKIRFNKKGSTTTLANAPPLYCSIVSIYVEESENYEEWSHTIYIEENSGNIKSIEDCYLALRAQTEWNGACLACDVSLPKTVPGFEGSIVEWESQSPKIFSNDGKLTKDLKDMQVEVNVHVAWRGEHRYSVFSTTVERLKKIQEIRQTQIGPTTIEFNLEDERSLLIYENDVLMKKYFIKAINTTKKELTLKLLEVRDRGGMVAIDDLQNNANSLELYVVILSEKYFKLKKASSVGWEELKDYMLDYFRFLNGNEYLPNEDEIFEFLTTEGIFGAKLNFTGSLAEFKVLEGNKRASLIKNMLESIKATILTIFALPKDTPDDKTLFSIKEEYNLSFKYKIDRMKKTKVYSYSLDKNEDASLWPVGYSFENEAIFQKDLPWYEQNGRYSLYKKDPKIYVVTIPGYKRKDNTFALTLIYDNSTGTQPAPRYEFVAFIPCSVKKEMYFTLEDFNYKSSISGKIEDNRDNTLRVHIERFRGTLYYKPLEGHYSLTFNGEIIE